MTFTLKGKGKGKEGSIFLIVAQEMRSVLNYFVSDFTFSLDIRFSLLTAIGLPIFFPEQSESTLAPGQEWNREFRNNHTAECQNPKVVIIKRRPIPLGRGPAELSFLEKKKEKQDLLCSSLRTV